MARKKIALLGAGNIGGMAALLAIQRNLGDIILFDINEGLAKGKALDLAQSQSILGHTANIYGTCNYADIAGADVAIVTAGIPRKPGMSRDDLLKINGEVITTVAEGIATYCPQAFVIVVTNPLDIMVWLLQKESQLPFHKVVGMAGVLDSARYSYFLAQELNVAIHDVQTIVLGGHGDTMVPIQSGVNIAGVPLSDFVSMRKISSSTISDIIDRTRFGGGEIVELLKNGSAFYAPAAACIKMAQSYLLDEKRLMPCAAYLNGEYGFRGLYAGVPVIIGKDGVESIVELPLNESEAMAFENSIRTVENLIETAENVFAKKVL